MSTEPEKRGIVDQLLDAAEDAIRASEEIATSTGAHTGHNPRQVGRCVRCSCGARYQGRLKTRKD